MLLSQKQSVVSGFQFALSEIRKHSVTADMPYPTFLSIRACDPQ